MISGLGKAEPPARPRAPVREASSLEPEDSFRARAPGDDLATAWQLARCISRRAGPETARAIRQRLSTTAPEDLAQLGELADDLSTWHAEGWVSCSGSAGQTVWTNSRAGSAQLTTLPVSLEGMRQCRLGLKLGYRFTSRNASCVIEAAPPGGGWQPLQTLAGEKALGTLFVDLSAYDGQAVQLRFRVQDGEPHQVRLEDLAVEASDIRGGRVGYPLDSWHRAQAVEGLLRLAAEGGLGHLAVLSGPDRGRALAEMVRYDLRGERALEFLRNLAFSRAISTEDPAALFDNARLAPARVERQPGAVVVGGVPVPIREERKQSE